MPHLKSLELKIEIIAGLPRTWLTYCLSVISQGQLPEKLNLYMIGSVFVSLDIKAFHLLENLSLVITKI